MKSRIEILDECATKWSRMYNGIDVDTFEDYVNCYPSDMVLKVVYSAMAEYNKPINNGALDIVSLREIEVDDVVCTTDGKMWVVTEVDCGDLLVCGNGKKDYPLEKADVTHAH